MLHIRAHLLTRRFSLKKFDVRVLRQAAELQVALLGSPLTPSAFCTNVRKSLEGPSTPPAIRINYSRDFDWHASERKVFVPKRAMG